MHKVSARWIPRLLTPFQKRERVECSKMNLEMCQEDESKFFKTLITQDETWVYHYDPETKVQSMQWKHLNSPPPKKARVQPSAGKVMLTVFWDQDGVVMTDFLAKGTTITGAYYASLLRKLREAIEIKRQGKISKGILLLQDNAPVHNSHVDRSEARACGYEILPHPPYSPTLHPLTFTSSQPWSCFWKDSVSQMMQPWFLKSRRGWRTNLGFSTKTVSRVASNDWRNA